MHVNDFVHDLYVSMISIFPSFNMGFHAHTLPNLLFFYFASIWPHYIVIGMHAKLYYILLTMHAIKIKTFFFSSAIAANSLAMIIKL